MAEPAAAIVEATAPDETMAPVEGMAAVVEMSRDAIVPTVTEVASVIDATAAAEADAIATAAEEDADAEGEEDEATAGQKRRRNRQSFNRSQVSMLEHIFNNTPMPRQALLNELSQRLDIPPRSVRVWFQNRRQRWKQMHTAVGQTPPPLRNAEDRLTSLEKLLPDLPPSRVGMLAYQQQYVAIPMASGSACALATAISSATASAGAVPATGQYRPVRLVGVHNAQPVFRMEELTEVPNLMRTPTGGLLKVLPTGVAIEYSALGHASVDAPSNLPSTRMNNDGTLSGTLGSTLAPVMSTLEIAEAEAAAEPATAAAHIEVTSDAAAMAVTVEAGEPAGIEAAAGEAVVGVEEKPLPADLAVA